MTQAEVLGALGLVACLFLAAAHLLWLLPRLGARPAWAITSGLGLLAAWAALATGALWPLAAALALLFGHAGHALGGARARAPLEPSPSLAPAAPERAAGAVPAAAQPATLGRYRIESEIGRGSMGAVYLGRDPQIGRVVAIKTLALGREFAADRIGEARERFFREAETAGRLQHPDIVTIFDAGEADDLAWIAMEYVRGTDLQRFTAPGTLLPVPRVLEVIARVAEALSYAHSQGVVHRDIKPANVMIDLEGSLVKVMDFGVARLDDATRTRTGIVLGTPSFMSPEQMSGRRADGRSDLYSLGVMLFQLLTGTLPFEGSSMAELMRRIVNEPAPDVRSLRPQLPQALADVVTLTLEKRPEVRYADGIQIAQDLRAVAAEMLASGSAAPVQDDAFEKTVTFGPIEPRHNSAS